MAEEEKNKWIKKITKSPDKGKTNKLTKTPSDPLKQTNIKNFFGASDDVKWLKTETKTISNANNASKASVVNKKVDLVLGA